MPACCRPDGDERVRGQRTKLVPIEEQRPAEFGRIDVVALGKAADDAPLRHLVDTAEPLFQLAKGLLLLGGRSRRKAPKLLLPAKLDLVGALQNFFERDPPRLSAAGRIVAWNIDREWQAAALEDGISVKQRVAVAMLEGETHKALRVVAPQPLHGFVERHHLAPFRLDLIEQGLEKRIGDLRDRLPTGIGGFWRPHIVQGEDDSRALRIGREQAMGPKMVE